MLVDGGDFGSGFVLGVRCGPEGSLDCGAGSREKRKLGDGQCSRGHGMEIPAATYQTFQQTVRKSNRTGWTTGLTPHKRLLTSYNAFLSDLGLVQNQRSRPPIPAEYISGTLRVLWFNNSSERFRLRVRTRKIVVGD